MVFGPLFFLTFWRKRYIFPHDRNTNYRGHRLYHRGRLYRLVEEAAEMVGIRGFVNYSYKLLDTYEYLSIGEGN